ncbi:hypothetical protein [Haladaptatus cibarius]|uniref:hypothetical protein n=1 Tax=Haladaptatus cibarius TaxID=453847 RepID=UPI0006795B2F|nr:hypothetical protein [Haladaptatus cibarius]
MNRRNLLKNAASASALAFGMTATASATERPSLDDVSNVSVLNEQGERVTMSVEEADVNPEDCCFEPDGCNRCTCQCCYC